MDYSVTAFQLERIYQGRSEIDHNFVWNRVKRVADRLVAEKLKAKGDVQMKSKSISKNAQKIQSK